MDCYNPRITVPRVNTVVLDPWDTGATCHTMINSNVQTRPNGAFLKFGENVSTDRQGMWANFMYNAHTPNGVPLETYNNLQGSWARVGPSTYDTLHVIGDPYNRWGVGAFLPLPLKSLYDHPNADPKGMWRPDHFKKPYCD